MVLKQSLQQRLLQKLSPQQIQLMKMLQLPTVELEKRIKEELEINPALDEGEEPSANDEFPEDSDEKREEFNFKDYINDDTPSYKTQANNFSKGEEEHQKPLSFGYSLSERLTKQIDLKIKNENQKKIAEHIIGNLDESGYLRRELFNIVDDLAFSQNISTNEEELEQILMEVQELEPHGVGARDLKECLLIQLRKKKKTIAIKDAIAEIVKLNPKPGNSLIDSQNSIQQITPDFTLTESDGVLSVELNQRNAPQLRVSKDYIEMIKGFQEGEKKKRDKEAILFVKQKVDSAKWFIEAVKQRQNTLLITMEAIVSLQKEFFLSGDEKKLKPMILKDIATIVSMDISTISRVANSKHVSTPYGIFSLKYFFSESLTTESGEEVSTREVKTILNEAIDKEDKGQPLTDEKLASLLKEKGYLIARRTVAKYREQLNIPVARLRKELL